MRSCRPEAPVDGQQSVPTSPANAELDWTQAYMQFTPVMTSLCSRQKTTRLKLWVMAQPERAKRQKVRRELGHNQTAETHLGLGTLGNWPAGPCLPSSRSVQAVTVAHRLITYF
ncbi:unnamed protein product [Protopolystoma xenopodis]|uniref:Uncharacterized protein n=1 Tax=Protopolystoma xenopodis TaxID=117903 RepID=A0A3S5AUP0_9PLAT|nr:unnamed protein product [Protopolystoma xenopodis]